MAASTDELKRDKEAVEAQAAVVQAQAALAKAMAELQALQAPLDPAVVAANAEKARLDATKGALEARQAASTTASATALGTAQARVGTVTPPGNAPSGAVETGANAGKGEATLLAARAIRIAAERTAAEVGATLGAKTVSVLVGSDGPQLASSLQFSLRERVVEELCASAIEGGRRARGQGDELKPNKMPDPETAESVSEDRRRVAASGPAAIPVVTTVGVALEALSKLAGYFRSDFTVTSIDVAGDSSQLAAAVAGALLRLEGDRKPSRVILPKLAAPNPGTVGELLSGVLQATSDVRAQQADLQAAASGARSEAGSAQTDDWKRAWTSAAEAYEKALPLLKQALSQVDEFMNGLVTADASGVPFVTKVVRDRMLQEALSSREDVAVTLYVDVRNTVGGAYAKRNLWTFLGGMPFYAMGGVVVAFTAVQASTGEVLASGVIPIHGGYSAVDGVARQISSLYDGSAWYTRRNDGNRSGS